MPRGKKSIAPTPKRERYYKATEAARTLGITTSWLGYLRRQGKICASVGQNGRYVYSESEIERLRTPMTQDEYIANLCK